VCVVTLQMLKWQPAVETVRNGDGSCADGHLFDRVRQLDASEQNVANVHHYQLIQQHDTFIDDVRIQREKLLFFPMASAF